MGFLIFLHAAFTFLSTYILNRGCNGRHFSPKYTVYTQQWKYKNIEKLDEYNNRLNLKYSPSSVGLSVCIQATKILTKIIYVEVYFHH